MVEIEQKVSITERHRAVKVWRALWTRMCAMKLASGEDPSKAVINSAPQPRDATWSRKDVLVRVQRAWRMGYFGLAACMATAWGSMCSPVDVRRLTPSQVRSDVDGIWFAIGRAKKAAAARWGVCRNSAP